MLVSLVAISYPVVLVSSVKIRSVYLWQNADALNTSPCIIIDLLWNPHTVAILA